MAEAAAQEYKIEIGIDITSLRNKLSNIVVEQHKIKKEERTHFGHIFMNCML